MNPAGHLLHTRSLNLVSHEHLLGLQEWSGRCQSLCRSLQTPFPARQGLPSSRLEQVPTLEITLKTVHLEVKDGPTSKILQVMPRNPAAGEFLPGTRMQVWCTAVDMWCMDCFDLNQGVQCMVALYNIISQSECKHSVGIMQDRYL